MLPTTPKFMAQPFANSGNKNTIPETNDGTEGLASLESGFPQITEKPLASGGLPPTRKDFNGILNWLAAFCFYQQGGGLFTYSATADYNTPAVVMHGGVMYYCKKQNGPSTTAGAITPGTNSTYWITLIEFLLGNAEAAGVKLGSGVPVGTVIMWASTTNPSTDYGTWIDCDGRSITNYPDLMAVLGGNKAPNYSGLFPRCIGSYTETNSTYGTVVHSAPSLNSVQTDAIRNITGTFAADDTVLGNRTYAGVDPPSGCFRKGADGSYDADDDYLWDKSPGGNLNFNASYVVPTANENRPVNVGVRFLIKAAD